MLLEYCPLGQAVHWRFAVAEGVLLTKVPGGQFVHGVQAGALVVVLNCPLAQAAHTRSISVVPSEATNLPGAHAVLATQGVAALPSLSQVPAAQAVCGLVPPAQ